MSFCGYQGIYKMKLSVELQKLIETFVNILNLETKHDWILSMCNNSRNNFIIVYDAYEVKYFMYNNVKHRDK